ncbi:hypothetical protein AAD018_018405, partial [Aestuariibius insulae]
MQDDGNLVVYDDATSQALWSSQHGKLAEAGDLSGGWSDVRALEYIASHDDLMDAYGVNPESGRLHYNSSGETEARQISFSAADYVAANSDLQEAFGNDLIAASRHYIETGRYEGRILSPGGEPEEPDARLVFNDADGNGAGEVLVGGAWLPAGIEDPDAYFQSGIGIVDLGDGRRMSVLRDGGAPFPVTDLGPTLSSGIMAANERLVSANGQYSATFQTNGDFVVRQIQPDGAEAVLWTSNTGDGGVDRFLALQANGNLGVYDATHVNLWDTATGGYDPEAGHTFSLSMQDDGNLVLYSDSDGEVLWSSLAAGQQSAADAARAGSIMDGSQIYDAGSSITSMNGRFGAVFQEDGNLVVYDHTAGQAIWDSGTAGDAAGGVLAVQRDGNLVIYTEPGQAEWASDTANAEADRDFVLQIGDDGNLVLSDTRDGGALWSSMGGTHREAGGIAQPGPLGIPTGDAAETYAVTLNGEEVVGDVSGDTVAAAMMLAEWLAAGILSQDQYLEFIGNPTLLSALDKAMSVGSGQIEVNSEAEIALREMLSQTEDQIRETLSRGFDLAAGPEADQLAALNLLAYGHSPAFYEILMNWTLTVHPGLDLRFDYNTGRSSYLMIDGERVRQPDGRFFFKYSETQEAGGNDEGSVSASVPESEFLDWLVGKLSGGDAHRHVPVTYFREGSDHEKGTFAVRRNDDGDYDTVRSSVRVAPNLENLLGISRDLDGWGHTEREALVEDILGKDVSSNSRRYDGDEDHRAMKDPATVWGFDFDDNWSGHVGHFGSALYRESMDLLHPGLLEGFDAILLNADDAVVENQTQISDYDVIAVGGSDLVINGLSGDGTISLARTTDTTVIGGAGFLQVDAEETDGLRVEDTVEQSPTASDVQGENGTIIDLEGDTTGTSIHTDEDVTAISLDDGIHEDVTIIADGNTSVEVEDGATIRGGYIDGDDAELEFTAQPGSTLEDIHIDGGDGDDRFTFGGDVVKGSVIETGDGSDYIVIHDTFTGEFDLSDTEAAWMWANRDDIYEFDTVALEALQGEGWQLLETEDGKKLIARDETGAILAQINLTGDSDHLESIYTFDENGKVASLQNIAPEVRFKLAWLGTLSSVLMFVGNFFPP